MCGVVYVESHARCAHEATSEHTHIGLKRTFVNGGAAAAAPYVEEANDVKSCCGRQRGKDVALPDFVFERDE